MMITADPVAANGTQYLRKLEDLVADLAACTGLPASQIDEEIDHLNFTAFEFQGLKLVSPTLADQLIDRWADSIKTKLRTNPPASSSHRSLEALTYTRKTRSPRREASASAEALTPTPTPSFSLSNLPDIELKVPRDVFKLVSTRYGTALSKILPKDPESKQAYLQHIVMESEQGHEFLMQIAIVLAKKYKGRVGKDKAYNKMLAQAQALVAS